MACTAPLARRLTHLEVLPALDGEPIPNTESGGGLCFAGS
jgi:hypothetical protein